MRNALLIMALTGALAPAAASAQSMNVPLIVNRVVTGICAPLIATGDLQAAVRAAREQGYEPTDWSKDGEVLADGFPSRVVLDGRTRHIGVLTLVVGRNSQCTIDMAEASLTRIVETAGDELSEIGLTLVHDGQSARPGAAVWRGEGRLAVAQPGRDSPGHMLTISWDRPPGS